MGNKMTAEQALEALQNILNSAFCTKCNSEGYDSFSDEELNSGEAALAFLRQALSAPRVPDELQRLITICRELSEYKLSGKVVTGGAFQTAAIEEVKRGVLVYDVVHRVQSATERKLFDFFAASPEPVAPRVPAGFDIWRDTLGNLRLDDTVNDLHIVIPSSFLECDNIWQKVVGGLLDAMLTASPEPVAQTVERDSGTLTVEADGSVSKIEPKPTVWQYTDEYGEESYTAIKAKALETDENPMPLYAQQVIADLRAENETLRQLVKDTCDDMECESTCDSFGHSDSCPVANPVYAWRHLRAEVESLKEENRRLTEVMVTGVTPDPVNGGMVLGLEGGMLQVMADCFAETFKGRGAKNFLSMDFTDKDGDSYTVTMQKAGCETPAEKNSRLSAEVEALRKAAKGMVRIVEEFDGAVKHGTWCDSNGMRLKDTPEWVALYLAARLREGGDQ